MSQSTELLRLPVWLQRPPGSDRRTIAVKELLRQANLNTVCEEARCPNICECFGRKTATFMILGDICTRGCRFCSVATGRPHASREQFAQEANRVAQAAKTLGLKYVVVTSVTRDDLSDGGASGFVATVEALRRELPGVVIELLVPDFRGNENAIRSIIEAGPDVLNHNLETVPRLYRRVRPGASYERSLRLLTLVGELSREVRTKTGIMLGLGESETEVFALMRDARGAGVEMFTAGQYLRPSSAHVPVEEYLPVAMFDRYRRYALELGFSGVAVGPLVRSSFHADAVFGGRGVTE